MHFRFIFVKMVVLALFACGLVVARPASAHAAGVLASWYGPGFYGKPTASGEPYDAYAYTAASRTLPLGTRLVVSRGGRSVEVTINDRGPYVGARALDLSQAAAQSLGLIRPGVAYVDYSVVSYPQSQTAYPQEPAAGRTYTVRPGDTLTSIAAYLGVSVGYLARYNGLANPDYIRVGQVLYY
ncbi:septal ring lytic transglycosylase RlpA family protein [Rubrobacter calidifluminis]|uniref:septal ring lytic transglycosylase RlpA family protein n=1 Tax=Rubrobacter calidifluminis TaxID=1392640 RepID=UPI00235E1EF9|nr:septal ring lytic transglycosylase RlpA family protein [Rubrobacter calidifluminis]